MQGGKGLAAPGEVFEKLVNKDDREGEPHDGAPLRGGQGSDGKHERGRGHIQDEAVQRHGQRYCTQQPQVAPGRQLPCAQKVNGS